MAIKLGVLCFENWKFLEDIYNELSKKYEVRSFGGYHPKSKLISDHERIKGFIENRLVNKNKIKEIMKWSDITFFEWASFFLEIGTHLPKKSKIVTRMHRWELFKFIERIKWEKIDKMILVNQGMRKWFLERLDFDVENIEVIYNAINTDIYRPIGERNEPSYRLGMLGDVIPRKRVYEQIIAFKELLDVMPETKFVLSIGGKMEGEYAEFVRNLIKRLKLTKRVILEGYIDDIVQWYNNIDIIISNSMHESAHLTLYEGGACGCYAISHWWDGVEEFLPKKRLYFTNTEFCERVQGFYELSTTRRMDIAKKSREHVVKTMALPIIVKQFQKVFDNLV
jgi:glycosyltransferase involved in cell wall biosynthesis